MDNAQNANISGGNLSLVTSVDQNDQIVSHHEVMMRRLKNRERQRRYRARKRLAAERMLTYTSHTLEYLEADTNKGPTSMTLPKEIKRRRRRKKESTVDQFSLAQMEMPLQYLEADTMKGPTSLPMPKEIKRRRRRKKESTMHQFTPDQIDMPLQYLEADTMKGPTSLHLPKEIKRRRRRKKESSMDQFLPVEIEMPLNGTPHDFATRVHSRRDWKRDARRAHIFVEQEIRLNAPVIPVVTSVSGSQVQAFASGVDPPLDKGCQSGGAILVYNEGQKVVPSRKHWKEEARNKKS